MTSAATSSAILAISDTVSKSVELCDIESQATTIATLLRGPDYLLIIFSPYSFGSMGPFETLILKVNERLAFFTSKEVKIIQLSIHSQELVY